MNNQVNWMQQGWECPKCGAVMSPHTDCCVNCRGNKGGGTATSITDGNPINKIQEDCHLPNSICSTGPCQSVIYAKEDPTVKYSALQTKSLAVGSSKPIFDAAGCPPELSFDNSGYKENPEEQWERYQLNV